MEEHNEVANICHPSIKIDLGAFRAPGSPGNPSILIYISRGITTSQSSCHEWFSIARKRLNQESASFLRVVSLPQQFATVSSFSLKGILTPQQYWLTNGWCDIRCAVILPFLAVGRISPVLHCAIGHILSSSKCFTTSPTLVVVIMWF